MDETILWWLILQAAGIVALPLCLALFDRLPDRGFALSKPVGLLFIAYAFWLANSLRILPNSRAGVLAAVAAIAIVSAAVLAREASQLIIWVKQHWRYALAVDAAFLAMFITAAWLRAQAGQLYSVETPTDLMFLNATAQAAHFPPRDAWFSGYDVSYYYFGFVIIAAIARVAAIPAEVAYNLGLPTIFALTATAAFGVVYNLTALDPEERPERATRDARRMRFAAVVCGVAGAYMLAVMGNLVAVLSFASSYGIGGKGFYDWIDVGSLTANEPRATWYPSRIFGFGQAQVVFRAGPLRSLVPFPSIDWILGDVHAHFVVLPFTLLAIALVGSFAARGAALRASYWRRQPLMLAPAAVIAGAPPVISTWEAPTLLLLASALVCFHNLRVGQQAPLRAVAEGLGFALPLFAVAALAYAPYYLGVDPQDGGLYPVVFNDVERYPSRPLVNTLLHWAPLWSVALLLVGAALHDQAHRIGVRAIVSALAVPVAVVCGWVALFEIRSLQGSTRLAGAPGIISQIRHRGDGWLTDALLAAFLAAALLALWSEYTGRARDMRGAARGVALLLISLALLLILTANFFYVGDPSNLRTNFEFKYEHQAWVLLATAGGVALFDLWHRWSRVGGAQRAALRTAAVPAVALLILGGLFPVTGWADRIRPSDANGRIIRSPVTLDGLRYINRDERAAMDWLRTNATPENDVILEAVVDQQGVSDYSYAGRMSTASGIPAVLAWPKHIEIWHGRRDEIDRRMADVQEVYATDNLARAFELLRRYGATYVVVGQLERSVYTPAQLDKFAALPIAFESGAVRVYRVPPA